MSAPSLPKFPGYHILETVLRDSSFAICRALRETDERHVLIRIPNLSAPEMPINALRREYEFLRDLPCDGILRPIGFEQYRGWCGIVYADFEGLALNDVGGDGFMEIDVFLPLAVGLADALCQIHARRIVHNQVRPSNILFEPRSGQAKLVGFELAERLSNYTATIEVSRQLKEGFAYISPELSGRLNCGVDYRSDLYSLGAVYYCLLAGTPPFVSDDPAELIYSHIARQPERLSKMRPDLPNTLSQIVDRLLAKDPAGRYQSAFGLFFDLSECLVQHRATGRIELEIGLYDPPQEPRIPLRLYGRSSELEVLKTAARNCLEGRREIVLISGPAGAGKSTLAREASRLITDQRGRFCVGKFERLRRDIPYSALVEAFQEVFRQVLAEDRDRLARTRRELEDGLRGSAPLLVRILPQIELLLGRQPPAPPLAGAESTVRLQHAICQLVRVLATREHPLAMFLDDLQWADSASVSLIRILIADRDVSHFALIGAYRDNEAQLLGTLAALLCDIDDSDRPARRIHLPALARADVIALLSDALHLPGSEVASLAEVVCAKTQANPFFVKEFIASLHHTDILQFDPGAGRWRWDLQAAFSEDMTENVVDLVRNRLDLLPDQTRQMLQLAAVIGNRFTLGYLATVSGRSAGSLRSDINRSVAEELIVPVRSVAAKSNEQGTDSQETYRFAHDRIQQAAYGQIAASDLAAWHHRIGRLLRRDCTDAQLEERIFEIANHVNAVGTLPAEDGGRMAIAELNLRAARKAKASAAFDAAWQYLKSGLVVIDEVDWEERHSLVFALHREATEVAYLLARYGEMQTFAATALTRARTELEQVEIYEIAIRYCNSSMDFTGAVETGLKAAQLLGESLPANPSKIAMGIGLLRVRLMLRGRGCADLRRLPEMKDPRTLAALRIMALTASAAYFARPYLFVMIVFRMVALSITNGAASLSAFAYVCYGLVLCAVVGEMTAGFEYGRLALDTLERFEAQELKAKVVFLFNVFIAHWKEDMGRAIETFLDAAASGLETGDLEFFSYNLYMHCSLQLLDGQSLHKIDAAIQEHYPAVARQKQDKVELLLRVLEAVVADARAVAPSRKLGEPFDGENAVAVWRERQDFSGLGYWYCLQTFRSFAAGDYGRAMADAELAHGCAGSLMGQPFVPFLLVYESLAIVEALSGLRGRRRRSALRKLERNRKKLRRWATHAPANYRRKSHLLNAEWAALKGRSFVALREFDAAISAAAGDASLLDEGVASERAAIFCLRQGWKVAAHGYLSRATAAYTRWGAPQFRRASIDRLKSELGEEPLRTERMDGAEARVGLAWANEIDFASILKATRTLSEQVVLSEVVRELLTIAMANAGATRGFLLLSQRGSLSVEAEAEAGKQVVLQSSPVKGDGRVPGAILDYVVRTGMSVAINNVSELEPFADDPYIRTREVRSALCLPLQNQGELVGLLYLENDLVANAFTPARLDLLRVIAGQAAVSIRNAKLYANLERALADEVALTAAHHRFVPHQFLAALGKQSIAEVSVGEQVLKTLSIMFVDMRSYSTVSERLSPKDQFAFVNVFFGQIERAIVSNGGFIDSYYGDGIMALFEDDADHAVSAGIALLRSLQQDNQPRQRRGLEAVRVGIGINTGEVVLGTIGGTTSIKYGVVGDNVNLASRIETLTKHFNADLLIGESTYRALKDPSRFLVRNVGRVRVKGRSRAVTVHEVFDADSRALRDAKVAIQTEFGRACDDYYQRAFAAAASRFERCLAVCPDDRVAALFLQRSLANIGGVPHDWDGTETIVVY